MKLAILRFMPAGRSKFHRAISRIATLPVNLRLDKSFSRGVTNSLDERFFDTKFSKESLVVFDNGLETILSRAIHRYDCTEQRRYAECYAKRRRDEITHRRGLDTHLRAYVRTLIVRARQRVRTDARTSIALLLVVVVERSTDSTRDSPFALSTLSGSLTRSSSCGRSSIPIFFRDFFSLFVRFPRRILRRTCRNDDRSLLDIYLAAFVPVSRP